MRIAGASSLNSASDAFLAPALASSISMPTSFVQIQVEAYMFTLSLKRQQSILRGTKRETRLTDQYSSLAP